MCAAASAFAAGPDATTIIEMAHRAPGEFAADALLRIGALPSLSKEERSHAIQDAYQRAAEAQQPLKRVNSMPNRASNAAFEQRAFAQDLDALSLRTRAIQAMLALDPPAARRMFVELPPLDVPPVTCDEVMVFDVAGYYQTLTRVVRQTFSAKESQDGLPAQLVSQRLARMTSPAEVAPAARALLDSGLDDAGFALALAAYVSRLGKVAGDDRAFTFYLPQAGAEAQALASEAWRRKISPLPLIEAYRLYLVVNFSEARCADDDLMEGGSSPGPSFDLDQRSRAAVRFFNEKLRQAPVLTIDYAETEPRSKSGAASGMRPCSSAGCTEAARRYRALILNDQGAPIPTAARASTEWHDKFEGALEALREWEDAKAGPADDAIVQQFREKCSLYLDLASLSADAMLRQTALAAFAAYLERTRGRARTSIEWSLPVNLLIGRMAIDPAGWAGVAQTLGKSQDPVIALYAELEKVAPRTAPEVFALM